MDKEREIVYPKSNIYPSASTASFVFEEKKKEKKRKINIKKSIEDDDKRNINIASASIYLFWHQTKSTLKIISQNTKHKLYLLDARLIESTSNIEDNNEVSTW